MPEISIDQLDCSYLSTKRILEGGSIDDNYE